MEHVQIAGLDKVFGSQHVLRRCSLAIARGEVVTLLGASGCGKTTLLRCIAGFYVPEAGTITIDGEDVTRVPPNRRRVGFVFQNYALFPHLTVWHNVAYGLSVRRRPRAEIAERVGRALDLVAMGEFADRYPVQLSGGQQQRVAIARALVLEPGVLLLDEPFNALDAKLRLGMQVELTKLVKQLGITTVFVTHDQNEALTISDRIAVMRAGEIEQLADPLAIYDRPASPYVADFIGTTNLLPAEAEDGRVALGDGLALAAADSGPVTVVIRPENLEVASPGAVPGEPVWRGTISFVKTLGATVEYELELGLGRPFRALQIRRAGERALAVGEPVEVRVRDAASCVVLPGAAP